MSKVQVSKVRGKGQVTIPTEIREAARIEEGTLVEFELTSEGVVIRPKAVVDADQTWFWTAEWQKGEREASAELAAGRGETHMSEDEFLASLEGGQGKGAGRRRGTTRREPSKHGRSSGKSSRGGSR